MKNFLSLSVLLVLFLQTDSFCRQRSSFSTDAVTNLIGTYNFISVLQIPVLNADAGYSGMLQSGPKQTSFALPVGGTCGYRESITGSPDAALRLSDSEKDPTVKKKCFSGKLLLGMAGVAFLGGGLYMNSEVDRFCKRMDKNYGKYQEASSGFSTYRKKYNDAYDDAKKYASYRNTLYYAAFCAGFGCAVSIFF